MTPIILAVVGYALVLPILLRLTCVAHSQVFIKRKIAKLPKTRQAQANLPKPLWPKIKERVRFAMKDVRPFGLNKKKPKESGMPIKTAVKIVWLLGFIATVAAVFMKIWPLLGLAPIFFLASMTMCLVTASPVLKEREKMYRKMFEIGRANLGLSSDYAEQPQAVIQVLEWRSILAPSKVKFEVPTTFNADSEENFQRQFNQVFGTETTWVPFNDPEAGTPGWNYADGFVTLKETPPLPGMAPWNERYVLDPAIAWSFFPIGLGVENGVEMTNPETGELENVLGFDVSGIQVDLAKKMGIKIGGEITTSPMVLAAGGTGGGKALNVDTMIYVARKADAHEQSSSTADISPAHRPK